MTDTCTRRLRNELFIFTHNVQFTSEREYCSLNDFSKSSLSLRTFSFFAPRVIAYKNRNVIQAANDLDPLFSSSGYARQANHLSLAFSGLRWIISFFFFLSRDFLFVSPVHGRTSRSRAPFPNRIKNRFPNIELYHSRQSLSIRVENELLGRCIRKTVSSKFQLRMPVPPVRFSVIISISRIFTIFGYVTGGVILHDFSLFT